MLATPAVVVVMFRCCCLPEIGQTSGNHNQKPRGRGEPVVIHRLRPIRSYPRSVLDYRRSRAGGHLNRSIVVAMGSFGNFGNLESFSGSKDTLT